jgi:limonene-1,2-epoxide hydrolase
VLLENDPEGKVSDHHEKVVLSLIERLNNNDNAGVLECFAPNAAYRVNAWNEPLVGVEAIAGDFERQHALWSDLRIRVDNIASNANVVFTERVDTVTMMGRDIATHMVGVFELDDDDKIVSWRDYFDMKEVESQLGS